MRFKRLFSAIDTHTNGKPTRTVIGGLPYIKGKTILEKMMYLKENQDWVRKILICEPRGGASYSGAILTDRCTAGTDIGVIYMDSDGYVEMSEHDTIGVATTLLEAGIIECVEPFTSIKLDTPAGIVNVKVKVEGGVAKEVTILNKGLISETAITVTDELEDNNTVVQEITGSAYVTGIHTFVVDPDDPWQD